MCKIRAILFAIIAFVAAKGSAQEFFNLTADEVRIDSVLPVFTYTKHLGVNFADSVYEVRISYPEYIEMSKADIERYKRISNKPLPKFPVVDSYVAVDRKQGVLDVAFVPLVKQGGKYKKLASFKLDIIAKAQAKRAARATRKEQRYINHSVMATGKWAKIRVPSTGIYNLTADVIRRAGFSNPDKVRIYGYGGNLQPEILTADYLAETDDLKEVPTCTEGGKRLFWAKGPVYFNGEPMSVTSGTGVGNRVRNTYSDYGYYLITEGNDEPAHISSDELLSRQDIYDYYCNALYEVDDYAWFHGGRHLFNSQAITAGSQATYSIDMPRAENNRDKQNDLKIKIVLSADAASTAEIKLNGESLCNMTISKPTKYSQASLATSVTTVSSSAEKLDFTISNISGGNIRLDYIWVHRPYAPMPLPDIASSSFPAPEFVYGVTNQDLHSHTTADMIIIIPASQNTRAQAERLKALHEQKDGMKVRIVPADEIFNEFSSGTPDATAYKRYMKMLYDRAATAEEAPKYLLLMGDCAWDNRMNCKEWSTYSPDNFLLSYESENSVSSTDNYVTDDFFCMLDDNEAIEATGTYKFTGKMDVAVGRIPASNADEAKIAVDKIVRYASNENPGIWQNTIVIMGDDGDNNSHMEQAEKIAKNIETAHPAYDVKRIIWDAYKMEVSSTGNNYPEVTNIIKDYISNGALIMNYTGHGSPYSMSHEYVISASDLINAKNKNLPLWVAASCDITPYDTREENFGEGALFNSNGGAVAFLGAARTVYSSYNQHINYNFMQEVLNTDNGKVAMGEAVRRSKNRLVEPVYSTSNNASYQDATSNKLQYALLGDPALYLAIPSATVVIDSIDGKSVTEGQQTLKAGEVVTVTGHIENGGVPNESFNGRITTQVQDVVQHVVCNLNPSARQESSDDVKPFEFDMRQNNIFKGSDNVRGGRFCFSFAVPKDISYSDETGKIILYAVSDDNTVTAAGWNEMIAFNGYDESKTDSLGPSVFCYLNEERFTNGDVVNATPYFVAQLYDEDGINASGSGIGHNMQLIIDGDMNKTYNLNDFFTYDFGSYQSGTVGFSIPALEAGKHTLTFRAWDVLNNSTTAQLDFRVEHGIQPKLIDISSTRNPATTSTQFCIVSDRIGTDIDFMIDVFDISGRHLWSHAATATPDLGGVFVDWDLSMSSGGRLSTGVYLYRVRVRAEGSSYVSKAKKLIIIQ